MGGQVVGVILHNEMTTLSRRITHAFSEYILYITYILNILLLLWWINLNLMKDFTNEMFTCVHKKHS